MYIDTCGNVDFLRCCICFFFFLFLLLVFGVVGVLWDRERYIFFQGAPSFSLFEFMGLHVPLE